MGVVASVAGFCIVALLVYVLRYSGRLSVAQSRLFAAAPADVERDCALRAINR